jgi:autotransporter-associated beta strand protein
MDQHHCIRWNGAARMNRRHPGPRVQVEQLESRLLLHHGPTVYPDGSVELELDDTLDQFGFQAAIFQAYEDQVAFSIFDTGASVVTISATDQFFFQLFGTTGIPVKVLCGAVAEGVGGALVGHVSEPGTVMADGLHISALTFDEFGFPQFNIEFDPATAAIVPDVQTFIGALIGDEVDGGCEPIASESLPTITGTPILNPSPDHPNGVAASIHPSGELLDFSDFPELRGLVLPVPDVSFQEPGLPPVDDAACLQDNGDGTFDDVCTDAVRIAVDFVGFDNHLDPGNQITESYNPVQKHVSIEHGGLGRSDQTFLFDTGAQLSIISVDLADALGLDLDNPDTEVSVQGAGGVVENLPGFTIDRLAVPLVGGGTLSFLNAPVYVLDVAPGLLDGILGMNLFNYASTMLYDPFDPAGPSLQISFFTEHLFGTSSAVPEAEPNNSTGTATVLPSGAFGVAAISPANDTDFWVTTGAGAGDLIFAYVDTQDSTSSKDSTLTVIGNDQSSIIEFDDNDGPGLSSVVAGAAVTQSGNVYFNVNAAAGSEISSYDLYAAIVDPADTVDETEGNDTAATATPIPILTTVMTGTVTGSDVDYYSFFATEGSRVVVMMDNDPDANATHTHAALTIVDPDGSTVLASGDDVVSDGTAAGAVIDAPATGTYFVRVANGGAGQDSDYRFVALVLDAGIPFTGLLLGQVAGNGEKQAEEIIDNCFADPDNCDLDALIAALQLLINAEMLAGFAGTISGSALPNFVPVRFWDGEGSTNNWSDAANWSGDVVPEPADIVVFNNTSGKNATVDPGFGGAVGHILINSGYAGTVTLGRSLTLAAAGNFSQSAGSFDLAGQTLTIGGDFKYAAGTFQAVSGTVVFTGTGTIDVAGGAAFQNLTIQNGSLAIRAGDTLVVNGTLSLIAGRLTGPGALNLGGDLTVAAAATSSTIASNISLASPRTVSVANGAAAVDLEVSGAVIGSGGIIKSGAGVLKLSGPSTYAGATAINAGTVILWGGSAIPDGSAVVLADAAGATLDLNGTNETIGSLGGGGSAGGTVALGSGTLTTGSANTSTTFSGLISGSGGLTKVGTGSFYLRGSNTYAGLTTINGGSVLVSADGALGTAAAGTVVAAASSARLVFERSVNYTTAEPVTINGSGFNGIGSLVGIGNSSFAGPITLGSPSVIAAYPAGFSLRLDGTISTAGNALALKGTGNFTVAGVVGGSGALTKEGTGIVTLSNSNTYSGTTTVSGGSMLVTGSTAGSTVTVQAGANLGGTGSVGPAILNGGSMNPGVTLGILSGTTANFSSGGGLTIQLQGYTTAGAQFDRLQLSDALVLGGTSRLTLDLAGLSTTGTAAGIALYGSRSGAFGGPDLVNNPNNYLACLSYGATSLDVTIQSGGVCPQWVSDDATVAGVSVADVVRGSRRTRADRARSVTIASLDSGVDYTHPDLYQNIWINQAEIPRDARAKLTDVDRDGRITLRDLNRRTNLRSGAVSDVNGNGVIDAADLLRQWCDGVDDDGNGYVDDIIGWDFVHNDNDPMDDSGHGTHGAGIMTQVAPRAEVLPLKFLDADAVGSLAGARQALDYALAQGVSISSNGWAASVFSPEWLDEVKKADAAGHLLVTAAGNGDPALLGILSRLRQSNVLVVTASDRNGGLAPFANWDAQAVDLAVPGTNLLSAMPEGRYATHSGTSVSVALAAGIAGMLRSEHPNWNRDRLVDAILAELKPSPVSAEGSRAAEGSRGQGRGLRGSTGLQSRLLALDSGLT